MSLLSPSPLSAIKPHYLLFSSPIPSPRFLRRLSLHHRRSKLRSERNGALATITTSETQARSTESKGPAPPTFQQATQRLQEYWASVGCAVMQCSNTEVLRISLRTLLQVTPYSMISSRDGSRIFLSFIYVEPSIRPDDSRYGDNRNRLQRHTQFQVIDVPLFHHFQVILKPDPGNSQDLFLGSLSALGIDVNEHDVRFVEDNWESPVLGAWGLGWEIWLDGMEITQFTYFQQVH